MSDVEIRVTASGTKGVEQLNQALAQYNQYLVNASTNGGKMSATFKTTQADAARLQGELRNLVSEMDKVDKSATRMSGTMRGSLNTIGRFATAGAAFALVTQAVREGEKAFVDYNYQVARVMRSFNEGPGTAQFAGGLLGTGTINSGRDVKDVGEAFYQLAPFIKDAATMTSVFNDEMLLLKGTEGDARETTRLTLQIYEQFGESMKRQTTEAEKFHSINELLAVTFKNSAAEIGEVAQALKYLGPIAEAAHIPLEQVTAIVSTLTGTGQRGRQGGTEVRALVGNLIKNYDKELGGIVKDGFVYKFKLIYEKDANGDQVLNLYKTIGQIVEISKHLPHDEFAKFIRAVGGSQNAVTALGTFGDQTMSKFRTEIDNATAAMNGQTDALQKLADTMDNTYKNKSAEAFQAVWYNISTSISDIISNLPGIDAYIQKWKDETKGRAELNMSVGQDANAYANASPAQKLLRQRHVAQQVLDAVDPERMKNLNAFGGSPFGNKSGRSDMISAIAGSGTFMDQSFVDQVLGNEGHNQFLQTDKRAFMDFLRSNNIKLTPRTETHGMLKMFTDDAFTESWEDVSILGLQSALGATAGKSKSMIQAETNAQKVPGMAHITGITGGGNAGAYSFGDSNFDKSISDYRTMTPQRAETERKKREAAASKARRERMKTIDGEIGMIESQIEDAIYSKDYAAVDELVRLRPRYAQLLGEKATLTEQDGDPYGARAIRDKLGRNTSGIDKSIEQLRRKGTAANRSLTIAQFSEVMSQDYIWDDRLLPLARAADDAAYANAAEARDPAGMVTARGSGSKVAEVMRRRRDATERGDNIAGSLFGIPLTANQIAAGRATIRDRVQRDQDRQYEQLQFNADANQLLPGVGISGYEAEYNNTRSQQGLLGSRIAQLKARRAGIQSAGPTDANAKRDLEAVNQELFQTEIQFARLGLTLRGLENSRALQKFNEAISDVKDSFAAKEFDASLGGYRGYGESEGSYQRRQFGHLQTLIDLAAKEREGIKAGYGSGQLSEELSKQRDADLLRADQKYRQAQDNFGKAVTDWRNGQRDAAISNARGVVSGGLNALWHGADTGSTLMNAAQGIAEQFVMQAFDPMITAMSTAIGEQVLAQKSNTEQLMYLNDNLSGTSTSSSGSPVGTGGGAGGVGAAGLLAGVGGAAVLLGALNGKGGTSGGGGVTLPSFGGAGKNNGGMVGNGASNIMLGITALGGLQSVLNAKDPLSAGISGAMTGFAMGGPLGGAIGGAVGGLIGLFSGGKKKSPQQEMTDKNPAFYNSPSDLEYDAYRWRATGGQLNGSNTDPYNVMLAQKYRPISETAPVVIVQNYIDGVKSTVNSNIAAQTSTTTRSNTNLYADYHRP